MADQTPEDADLEQWLDASADIIASRGAFRSIVDGWMPARGSHAEWEQREAADAGWGEGNPPVVVQTALLDWCDAADGYLVAIETLFRSRQVTHAVPY